MIDHFYFQVLNNIVQTCYMAPSCLLNIKQSNDLQFSTACCTWNTSLCTLSKYGWIIFRKVLSHTPEVEYPSSAFTSTVDFHLEKVAFLLACVFLQARRFATGLIVTSACWRRRWLTLGKGLPALATDGNSAMLCPCCSPGASTGGWPPKSQIPTSTASHSHPLSLPSVPWSHCGPWETVRPFPLALKDTCHRSISIMLRTRRAPAQPRLQSHVFIFHTAAHQSWVSARSASPAWRRRGHLGGSRWARAQCGLRKCQLRCVTSVTTALSSLIPYSWLKVVKQIQIGVVLFRSSWQVSRRKGEKSALKGRVRDCNPIHFLSNSANWSSHGPLAVLSMCVLK